MNLTHKLAIAMMATLALVAFGSCRKKQTRNRLDEVGFPPVMLWAWERPEDFRTLDSKRFAVAFLAQTLTLKSDEVIFKPRHQPLEVSPDTKMMAVTRIESQKQTGERGALNDAQRHKLVDLIMKTTAVGAVSAIQIDFDAASSEREFYRSLLLDLRAKLPDNVPLSMTALASFCIGDRWLDDLPVDEAVPMIFRMGADDRTIKSMLGAGDDFREPLCQRSYGVALDEPFQMKFEKSRRVYVFNNRPWNEKDFASLQQRIQQ
ncbi:MAG TPA: DUF3142 domain-containing protein [Pyrinomonadaceae bacterium]|jgi:hypothetical protein